ncbi:MFS transporter [Agilicoccus flavus]|uniref:MFS transporter n=1 Tax=Agilicoccus flavus TaxID=2775968 RepID=UPI001CF6E411|nr:MFS transporter [Agilicoccus flavus]
MTTDLSIHRSSGRPDAPRPTRTTTPRTPGPRAGIREWTALVVLMLPVLVITLDNTVLSFAIPQLSASLEPTSTQLLWIIDVYPLCLASLLVTMGLLGDRLGRRLLLLVGAAGFGVVGLYAAFAPSAEHLIAARALRGVFGATLMPSTLSLLRNLFHDAGQRRLAIAIWGSGFAGGSAIGPIVGGWLLDHYAWGSIFLFTLPLIAVLLVAGPFLLPESRRRGGGRIDVPGVVMSLLAMVPFVFGIKEFALHGPSALAFGMLALGVVVGVAFARRQLALAEPLLDVRLFTHPVFTASIVGNFFSIFAFAGLVFYLSQYLQLVLGLDPMHAGTHLLPGALASIVAGLLAVRLARAWPLRVLVPAGIAVSTGGYALAATLHTSTPALVIVFVFVLVGAGVGLAETLTNDAILASVPAERAGAASGISETAYELGSALGVAILGSTLAATYRGALELPAGVTGAAADQARETLAGAAAAAPTLPPATSEALLGAARGAFMSGVELTSGVAATVTGLTAIVVAVLLHRAEGRGISGT